MCHHIPSPLENRVFPTLVVRAKTGADSFVVAQIPVDISKLPEAMYSNGRHRAEGSTAQKKEKVVLGQYTSIERVKPSHEHGKINWEMATASVSIARVCILDADADACVGRKGLVAAVPAKLGRSWRDCQGCRLLHEVDG